MRQVLLSFAAALAAASFGTDSASAQGHFYAGKTVTIVSHGGVGNNYDTYARMLVRHLGKHIPGRPKLVVVNMPGDGGVIATNYVAKGVPQDGTTFQILSDGLLMFDAAGGPGLVASLSTFKWLGALSTSNAVTATWYKSHIRTLDDAKTRDVRLGSSAAGATSSMVPYIYNAFIGTRFVVMQGYLSAPEQHEAMERGELDGRGAASWSSFRNLLGQHIDDGKLHPLVQIGLKREVDLPNTPLLLDLAGDDPKKRAIAMFVSKAMTMSRSVATGPGVPNERVTILRQALMNVVKDPEYLAEVNKFRLDTGFVSGADAEALVQDVLSTPKKVVRDAQTAMRND